MAYLKLPYLLHFIPEPNSEACRKFLLQNAEILTKAPGSSHNHQAWEGGYIDHIVEAMNIAIVIYDALLTIRPVPFDLGDALLAIFLHDVEKPWKYAMSQNELEGLDFSTKEGRHAFRRQLIERGDFQLTDEHWNAIEFAEGEIHKYSNQERHMGSLAAFCHMCVVWSARGWHDEPRASLQGQHEVEGVPPLA